MPLLNKAKPPMKPAEHAEHKILEAILDKSYGPGDPLPGERALAQSLGVTRPTLRETLQRLSKEGWVTIAHGKPTRVNDYLADGGLGILATLARYGDYLPPDMVRHLLETRIMLLPDTAALAAENDPGTLLDYLAVPLPKDSGAMAVARFDWGLQLLMVRLAGNPVVRMIFNDFTPVYHVLGRHYFSFPEARARSRQYYRELAAVLANSPQNAGRLVAASMADALELWERLP